MEQGDLLSADELEVAGILFDLRKSVLLLERGPKLVAWGRKRKRSCPAPPPAQTMPQLQTHWPSPDTPLQFSPSDCDANQPASSEKKVTPRRHREKGVEPGEAQPSSSREDDGQGGENVGRCDRPGLVNGPRAHLIDLNVPPFEESLPLDFPAMAILHQRARSAEARRYRKQVLKRKKALRTRVSGAVTPSK